MPTALITGANRGIGLELARQLTDKGVDVIGVCRSSSPELDALAEVWDGVDVGRDSCIEVLRERAAGRSIGFFASIAVTRQPNLADAALVSSISAFTALGSSAKTPVLRASTNFPVTAPPIMHPRAQTSSLPS